MVPILQLKSPILFTPEIMSISEKASTRHRFMIRQRRGAASFSENREGIISRYRFDESACGSLKILRFDSYSEEWLDFILSCRSGHDTSDYDIVSGGVANDRVFNTVELYYEQLIDKVEAIKRLRYEKPNMQIAFRSEAALYCLHYEGSEKL